MRTDSHTQMMKGGFAWTIFLFFLLGAVSFSRQAHGQEPSSTEMPVLMTAPVEAAPILEKSIDPSEYVVGAGDVLSIDVWGEINVHHTLTVTPEGSLLIPGVGRIQVGGERLADAKNTVQEAVLKSYRSVPVTITLLKLKKVKVIVAGTVRVPGVYTVTANTRVSEAIDIAGGFTDSSSTRNITVTHPDGSAIVADVYRFKRLGDRNKNPYLLGGDVVFVPAIEKQINTVGIYGAVKSGGDFEYAPSDSLRDLIDLAYGLTMDVDLLKGELVRFAPNQPGPTTIPINLKQLHAGNDSEGNLQLLPDDRVFIRSTPKFHKKDQVIVNGEVYYPGVYNIDGDKTKLSEVVSRAGGITPFASLAEAEMVRTYNPIDPEFERLKKIPVADMTQSEYSYFKLRSREKPGRVACDFEKLFQEKSTEYDVTLKNGDVISIPTKSMVVNVSGSVINPGLVPYAPGEDYKYYISRAGGFSWKARKGNILVVKGQTGERMRPSSGRKLDPGDTILIPEKPERDYWKFFKDTMLVLGNIATVYLVIQQVTK
ncbi:MAG: polysaccharide biosynthesis/export family protein [Candidatus Zixiibacteriota bacterium]